MGHESLLAALVAVHCAAPSLTGGLDPTFGSLGRVSTPVGGGHGEATVIQPDDGIVTAGWRTATGGVDFALTHHDACGHLDASFGTDGIVTTDLGSADDEVYDAAATSDGGLVVVGRSDHGFAVARYHADGSDPACGADRAQPRRRTGDARGAASFAVSEALAGTLGEREAAALVRGLRRLVGVVRRPTRSARARRW